MGEVATTEFTRISAVECPITPDHLTLQLKNASHTRVAGLSNEARDSWATSSFAAVKALEAAGSATGVTLVALEARGERLTLNILARRKGDFAENDQVYEELLKFHPQRRPSEEIVKSSAEAVADTIRRLEPAVAAELQALGA